MKKLLFVTLIPIVGLSAYRAFAQPACPGGFMTEDWNECRTYVIYACPHFGARDSAACEAAALQGYLQSKRVSQQQEAATGKNGVRVKYRETPVDLADRRFEYLDTSKSSFITGAWYDTNNSYMVIGLQGIYYHYCRMPRDAWDAFRAADSFGKHYNAFIKGKYDCRLGGMATY